MNSTPFFSIIIPLFNKENYVKDSLKSILCQSFSKFEVIIVNDGSTDASLEVVNTFKDSRIKILNQENQGVSVARNKGIKHSKGVFVAFLDADDYWYPNHLEELYETICLFPKQSIFCMNYKKEIKKGIIKDTAFSVQLAEKHTLIKNFFTASKLDSIATPIAISINKAFLEKKGFFFDENIKSGEDIDLWIRMALNYTFIFNKKPTALYKMTVKNSLSKKRKSTDEFMKVIDKHKNYENAYKGLKQYLDLNRFSIALEYKMQKEITKYRLLRRNIKLKNLPLRRILFLFLPNTVLKWLYKIRGY